MAEERRVAGRLLAPTGKLKADVASRLGGAAAKKGLARGGTGRKRSVYPS